LIFATPREAPGRMDLLVEGDQGWVCASRGGIDAHPKSLLAEHPGPLADPWPIHHYQDFLHAIGEGREPAAPIGPAHLSTTLCHLANIAIVLQRPLRWDGARERFIGDPPADRMLASPMRAPWNSKPDPAMRLHSLIPALVIQSVWIAVPSAIGQTNRSLEKFRAYEQGKPISVLIETRAAIFAGTGDNAVRAAREQELAGFIASDAHPQAKAIAIDWLGCLGSAAAVPPLAAALQDPALAAPAAAALERIPGPEAAVAAEAAEFTQALENGNDDQRIEAALRSPNELLAGAALRLLRAGAGTPALLQRLAVSLDQVPAARQAALCDALASRPDAVASLRPALIARVRSGPAGSRPAALATLGRILRPDDLPMVLERASDSANPTLAAAARAALARATDPAIDDALARHAATGGPGTLAAIDALAARHAVQAVDALWKLAASPDAGTAAAAFKSLGILIPPAGLPALVEKLAAAQGNPAAGETGKLVWNVVRRHPEPAAAADLLEKLAASAPADMQQLLRRYAARLRPQDAPPQSRLNLPAGDDSPRLAPDFHEQLVHLNCGSFAEARGGGIQIRRTAGRPYQFGDVAHPLATVDFGKGAQL
jgi:hypothetical protein